MADVAVHTTITDRVAVLTLSHPARRNALNIALSALLTEAVQAVADDPGVGAVVVTGEDPAFCAGGDLAELATAGTAQLKTVYSGFLALAECPLPTIAAVNGAAVGAGLNLALATDLRLAGPRASFGRSSRTYRLPSPAQCVALSGATCTARCAASYASSNWSRCR